MALRQPYANANTHLVNPLAIVQAFSNADKHRALTPSLAQIRSEDLEIWMSTAGGGHVVEFLAETGTIIDPTIPVIRVRVPPGVQVRVAPPPIRVFFLTDVTGQPDVFMAEGVPDLLARIEEAVSDYAPLFPDLDWTGRRASWVTPDL